LDCLDAFTQKYFQRVPTLAGPVGQPYPDFDPVTIAQSERARGAPTPLVSGALCRFVAIGSNGHKLRRRIRHKGLNTACVDRRCDADFLCFDLRAKGIGTDCSVLDPLERNEVPGIFRVAPDDSASRGAGSALLELGRLLGIAEFAVWPHAEIGFRASVRVKINAVGMRSAIGGHRAKDRAWPRPD
jgi:hypothetical protein